MPDDSASPSQNPSLLQRMRQKPDEGKAMTFMDHLMELRKRLWISAITVILCMIVALAFYEQIFAILRVPLDNVNKQYAADTEHYPQYLADLGLSKDTPAIAPIISTSLLGTMMMVMWLGVGGGLVLSSPILVYEIWAFVAPGLREKERRAIRPVLVGGIVFFLLGCALTYYVLFPVTLDFVVWLDIELKVRPTYTIDDYMSLFINMMAITGLICEAPLVVGVLAKLAIVKPSYLTRYWRMCVLASFILGSIFSPGTDVISMLVFSVLLLSIYLISVAFAFIFYPREIKK